MIACLSDDDKVEINFGLDAIATEKEDAAGEKNGHTGRQRVLWEVGRQTEPIHDNLAVRAFNLYRSVLADVQNVPCPPAVSLSSRATMTTEGDIEGFICAAYHLACFFPIDPLLRVWKYVLLC